MQQVSYDCPPHLGYLQNSNGETAAEAFMKEHSETREKAEKAVKYMNNGLMLISTLIGTVNYAALLTPPGGYRQDKEDPLIIRSPRLPHGRDAHLLLLRIRWSCSLFRCLLDHAFDSVMSVP